MNDPSMAPALAQADTAHASRLVNLLLMTFAAGLTIWFSTGIYVALYRGCKVEPLTYFLSTKISPRTCAGFPESSIQPLLLRIASHPQAPNNSRWFVLRENGYCWIANVPSIGGAYRHSYARTAGGPFGSEQDATERQKGLSATGTCQ